MFVRSCEFRPRLAREELRSDVLRTIVRSRAVTRENLVMVAPTPEDAEHLVGLAALVRGRRRELRLSQADVAELAGVSPRFVYALEQGKGSVRLDKVLAVLAVLGRGLEVVRGQGDLRGRATSSP
jgi:y4mF family transcriptional regulator